MSLRTRSTQGLIVCVPSLVLSSKLRNTSCSCLVLVLFLQGQGTLRNTEELRNWGTLRNTSCLVLFLSCSFKDREHSGTECVFLCVSGSVAQETLTCPVSPDWGTLRNWMYVPFVCLVPLLRKHLLAPVSPDWGTLRNWMYVPSCVWFLQGQGTLRNWMCVPLCVWFHCSGNPYLPSVSWLRNTQELRNWMCVPSVSGSCRTEHTQALNGCSFGVWFLLVFCVPRLRNNQEESFLPSVFPVVLTPWVTGCCLEAQCLLLDRDDDLPSLTDWVTGCCLETQLIGTLVPWIRWGREWGSPSSAAGGEVCVASMVRLDCARFPHYCPSVVAPGHAGPTALITADSPTLAPTLLQTLPSGLLYRQSVGRCDGGGRRWGAELLLDTRNALSPVYSRLVSLPSP